MTALNHHVYAFGKPSEAKYSITVTSNFWFHEDYARVNAMDILVGGINCVPLLFECLNLQV